MVTSLPLCRRLPHVAREKGLLPDPPALLDIPGLLPGRVMAIAPNCAFFFHPPTSCLHPTFLPASSLPSASLSSHFVLPVNKKSCSVLSLLAQVSMNLRSPNSDIACAGVGCHAACPDDGSSYGGESSLSNSSSPRIKYSCPVAALSSPAFRPASACVATVPFTVALIIC